MLLRMCGLSHLMQRKETAPAAPVGQSVACVCGVLTCVGCCAGMCVRRYVDRLSGNLHRKAGQEAKMLAAAAETQARQQESRAMLASLQPKVGDRQLRRDCEHTTECVMSRRQRYALCRSDVQARTHFAKSLSVADARWCFSVASPQTTLPVRQTLHATLALARPAHLSCFMLYCVYCVPAAV